MNQEKDTQLRIDRAVQLVDTTRSVIIGAGAISKTGKCLKEFFVSKPVQIIADKNTFAVAGELLQSKLSAEGFILEKPFVFEDDDLYARMDFVMRLEQFLAGKDVIPVAVGSGTINDITKLAAGRNGLPYMAVATAASMDGYTAFGASISYNDSKQTFSCPAPIAVIADINVIALAPKGMNASGYADLIAKIPSGADWLVADALGIDPINQLAWDLTQSHLRELVSDPDGISSNDPKSLIRLTEGLIMTGLGMQVSKTSRPASGAEHQFSHLWDNQHHTFQGEAPSHGFKVGIGSLASEALYSNILELNGSEIVASKEAVIARWPEFKAVEMLIEKHFGESDLAREAIVQCRPKYVPADEITERVMFLLAQWPELKEKLRSQLLGASKMQQMLKAAGAPHQPEMIGIDRSRLLISYEQARLIRQRYTVLDLAFESGLWETCVNPLFTGEGFWTKNVNQ